MEHKNPIDKFIHDLGGTRVVARQLDLTDSTVSAWRGVGRIPKWRIGPVMEIAVREKVAFPNDRAA